VGLFGGAEPILDSEAGAYRVAALLNNKFMRLDMVGSNEPDQDVKMVLVAPDGKVYRDDDRAPGLHLPLIEVAQTPITGWYTLQVYRFNGRLANGDHRLFTLLYGLYNAGNPNCNDLPTRDL
jgi:hypothetical protein